jgi:hypothetical protein
VAENWSVKCEKECIYRVNRPDKIGQLNFGGRELVHSPYIIRHRPNCSLGFFIPSKKLEGELVCFPHVPALPDSTTVVGFASSFQREIRPQIRFDSFIHSSPCEQSLILCIPCLISYLVSRITWEDTLIIYFARRILFS